MNQKHVPNLELCQELDQLCKEKNITIPETEYQWALVNFSKSNEDWEWEMHHKDHFPSNWSNKNHIPAPLVSEQGEWLWNIFEEHNWDLLYKAYGEVFNFKGTQRIGELGIINLMKRPNMGIKMINYLIAEGIITKL